MDIAIVGGTGTLGSRVADELSQDGHEVRVLSRGAPKYRVDLTTGEGLDAALTGCEVVVDTSNNSSRQAARTLIDGTRRLLDAEQRAGVRHHVCVSVVGCELVPVGYFKVKAEQERLVGQGPVPWSVIRATQFHEYLASMLKQLARRGMLAVPAIPLQTVASAEVASVVAAAVNRAPSLGRLEVSGPEVADTRTLARQWLEGAGRRAMLAPLPLPGKLGRVLRSGALTNEQADVRGMVRFAEWLMTSVQ